MLLFLNIPMDQREAESESYPLKNCHAEHRAYSLNITGRLFVQPTKPRSVNFIGLRFGTRAGLRVLGSTTNKGFSLAFGAKSPLSPASCS